MTSLAERFAAVRAGAPAPVQLIAVSKTRSAEEVRALYDLGQRAFGENYPQELREKAPLLPDDIAWHFIGHLQRSNVKHVVPLVRLIHGVDSTRLLDEIDKRAAASGSVQEVLLQVHIAQEETKHGFSSEEVREVLCGPIPPPERWPHVRIRGLMGMATNTEDPEQVRAEFNGLASLFRALGSQDWMAPDQFTVLSMGMSGDAHIAVACGSTMVRIGSALFGERPTRQA